MIVGYARVSTVDQNLDLQINDLKQTGCDRVYEEKASGRDIERPVLKEVLNFLRKGDTLVVWKLDRLGRSLKDLIGIVLDLQKKEINFKCIREGFDTSTSGGKLIFHIFGSLAEFEREIIRERTLAGLKAARARGKSLGKPPKLKKHEQEMVKKLYKDHSNKVSDICQAFSISRATLYRLVSK